MKPTWIAAAMALVLAPLTALAAPDADTWRELDYENALILDTTKGRVVIEMVPEAAPLHVEQIKTLARQDLYDGLTFFRVIDWFMAQGGDPENTGEGGSQLPDLPAEFTFRRYADTPFTPMAVQGGSVVGLVRSLPVFSQPDVMFDRTGDQGATGWATYCAGVAGMARGEDPNSANSQYFLMREAYPSLDKRYTAWGRVILGLDVVRAFETGEPVERPDWVRDLRVAADVPVADRGRIYLMRGDSKTFARLVDDVRDDLEANFSACDVPIPVRIESSHNDND